MPVRHVTMSNTKAEIVAAAAEAGFGSEEEISRLTKTELIDLWPDRRTA